MFSECQQGALSDLRLSQDPQGYMLGPPTQVFRPLSRLQSSQLLLLLQIVGFTLPPAKGTNMSAFLLSTETVSYLLSVQTPLHKFLWAYLHYPGTTAFVSACTTPGQQPVCLPVHYHQIQRSVLGHHHLPSSP